MRSMLRVALLSLLVASTPLVAQQPNDTTHRAGWDWDLSSVLSSRRGFIPVPFAFGDPVVGFGGGLAVVFYRPPPAGKLDTVDMRRPPPSAGIGGVFPRPRAGGLARRVVWAGHGDRFRYLGIVGGGSAGLNYFGVRDSPLQHNPLDYTFEPVGTLQRVQARVASFPLYVGVEYDYAHTRSTFDARDALPVEVPKLEPKIDIGGLGGR